MDWAVIFDWDGVVVDSSRAHCLAWEKLADELGLSLPPEHMERGFGRKNIVIIPEILRWSKDPAEIDRLSNRKEALYRELLEEGHGALLPGARAFLRRLAAIRVPCAVGSSTDRANIEHAMEKFALQGLFADIASAEDCDEGKPAPDVFLAAADKMGIQPASCVVIEDAPYGVEAAHRGGMKAVGLLTSHPESTMSQADLIVKDLSELRVSDIKALL